MYFLFLHFVTGLYCQKGISGRTLTGGKICYKYSHYLVKIKGNQSREFLRKVDLLQRELEELPDCSVVKGLPFIQTFRSFSRVVESCFGGTLSDCFVDEILEFRRNYLSLGISVTPKVMFEFVFYLFEIIC